MNKAITLISENNLQPADAIVLRKKFIGMVDHYAIYLGSDEKNEPIFVANYTKGIKRISKNELNNFLRTLQPTHIEKFKGDANMRKSAIERAIKRLGEDSYHFFKNNCESFKNYVHFGVNKSVQAEDFNNVTGSLAIAGATVALGSLAMKNKKIAGWAIALAAIAGVAYLLSDND